MTIAMLVASFIVGVVFGAFVIIVLAERRANKDWEIRNVSYPKKKHWRDKWT